MRFKLHSELVKISSDTFSKERVHLKKILQETYKLHFMELFLKPFFLMSVLQGVRPISFIWVLREKTCS